MNLYKIFDKDWYKFSSKHNCFCAFTLAEVLITLVIIGVISAITIPTVVQNTGKQEFVARLKKSHSNLANALYKMNMNLGYPLGDYSWIDEDNFIEEFSQVANVIKKCENSTECFSGGSQNYRNVYKRLNGSRVEWEDGKSVILSDGQIYTYFEETDPVVYGLSAQDESNVMGRILVDINGQKNPNQYGYDTFFFYIVNGKGIVPAGSHNISDCRKTGKGITCAAKVLKEGKINY